MSLELITKSDFVGFRNIDFPEDGDTFAVYESQAEELVLTDLFGAAMYADMLANPTETKYETLINTYLKTMMLGFFYYYFNLDRESFSTSLGEFQSTAQNATRDMSSRNKKVINAWNAGLKQYKLCAEHVNDNLDTYTLYDETEVKVPLNVWGIAYNSCSTSNIPCDHDDYFIRGQRC